MTIVLIVVLGIVFLFSFVILFGAPYLPTMRAQQEIALDLLGLKPGQAFYDLGCGDGRMLRAAAKRGLKAYGCELNPVLCIIAWLNTLRYRKNVKIKCGNFWKSDIKKADGIFVFLINSKMARLDKFIQSQCKNRSNLPAMPSEFPAKKRPIKNRESICIPIDPLHANAKSFNISLICKKIILPKSPLL
jgi:SAM-dependent methyltransferase